MYEDSTLTDLISRQSRVQQKLGLTGVKPGEERMQLALAYDTSRGDLQRLLIATWTPYQENVVHPQPATVLQALSVMLYHNLAYNALFDTAREARSIMDFQAEANEMRRLTVLACLHQLANKGCGLGIEGFLFYASKVLFLFGYTLPDLIESHADVLNRVQNNIEAVGGAA